MEADYPAHFPDLPTASSIAYLTTSNDGVPSDLETQLAKAHIHELQSHLVSVKNLIDLAVKRAAILERAIETHKAVVSPIRRLPNELLAEIFSQVISRDLADIKPTQAPWLFTHVCRLWAGVALDTRTLWSRMVVYLGHIGGPESALMTKLFLERSGNLPLTVRIDSDDQWLPTPTPHPSFDAIVTHR